MQYFSLHCDQCALHIGPTFGSHTYASRRDGTRVICPPPDMVFAAERITGLSWEEALAKGLVQYMTDVLCLQCAEVFEVEWKDGKLHDTRCPRCGGEDGRYVTESRGTQCPRCREGVLRWKFHGVA